MTPHEFIAECQASVASGGGALAVAALVRAALSSQRDDPSWQGLEEFLYRSEDLLIVNLTLPPYAATPEHNHGMWAVVGISLGREVDRFFACENGSEKLKLVELQWRRKNQQLASTQVAMWRFCQARGSERLYLKTSGENYGRTNTIACRRD